MTRDIPYDPSLPCTQALRRALPKVRDDASASDLLFLERWEMHPLPGVATALRITQIRRANPELAAAIRAELDSAKRAPRRVQRDDL
jgi:hypothetical protein